MHRDWMGLFLFTDLVPYVVDCEFRHPESKHLSSSVLKKTSLCGLTRAVSVLKHAVLSEFILDDHIRVEQDLCRYVSQCRP